MGESLNTENSYLSVSNFPVVVLTECGLLSDLERTTVMEQLEDLITGSERHALVIDLTEGAALPDKQRIYVAEAIQMHSKAIVEKWAALAIVVGGPEHLRLTKAEFWLGISPVPGRVFSAIEPAMAWAQECVMPAAPAAEAGAPREPALRLSGGPARAAERPAAERITRSTRVSAAPKGKMTARTSPTTPAKGAKEGAAPARKGLIEKLGRKGLAATAVALMALLFFFGPTNGRLSGADARDFEAHKSQVALQVFRLAPKSEALTTGATYEPADKLGFAVSIPAKGHMMIFGVKSKATTFPVFPGPSSGSVSKSDLGTRLPMSYDLGESKGKVSFHLVYCPMAFEMSSCEVASDGHLQCPADCATSTVGLVSEP